MKSTNSQKALLIALFLHLFIVSIFWISFPNIKEDKKLLPEKRFGISLSEALEINDNSPSVPQNTPIPSPPMQTIVEKSPPSSEENNPLPLDTPKPLTPKDRDSLPFSVLHHYGEEFFNLSAGEQHYIIDNLQKIRKLNEIVGTRLLRDRPDDVDPMDNNVVEFTLNPDGSISDLSLEKNRLGTPLDELTLQTINLAHPKYPKPNQSTKIRIRVYIIIK
ncbi:energy transducer TonB [Sulfuricurvum sp.]|uniref:energy transducer TonB family protein n=1 Tax=Sulfuricurvum sp. TaxID=2025608 RepID=UPI0026033607|nr:energy transducer TonB [Sulfuricurvum sp.]MDD2780670.1 energy transducer TonB [Sulfuricurvum sp.]